jgi:hypothetical protein
VNDKTQTAKGNLGSKVNDERQTAKGNLGQKVNDETQTAKDDEAKERGIRRRNEAQNNRGIILPTTKNEWTN